MNKQSHFNVNVSRRDGVRFDGAPRYVHLFSTDIVQESDTRIVTALFIEKFPQPEFQIEVTHWECGGRTVDVSAE